MDTDKVKAIQRAVRVVLAFDAKSKTLAELIAKEIVEAVQEEREACARKADGLSYRANDEPVRKDDRCDTAQKIACWIRERARS